MGKVWENGDVQVVQYPSNLPTNVYPMDRLPQDIIPCLGELVFLPVYDGQHGSPTQGIVAVIELIISRKATDGMVVATVISTIASIMEDVGLSLSSPEVRGTLQSDVAMHKVTSYQSNNAAWLGTKKNVSASPGMSRTVSQRTLGNTKRM